MTIVDEQLVRVWLDISFRRTEDPAEKSVVSGAGQTFRALAFQNSPRAGVVTYTSLGLSYGLGSLGRELVVMGPPRSGLARCLFMLSHWARARGELPMGGGVRGAFRESAAFGARFPDALLLSPFPWTASYETGANWGGLAAVFAAPVSGAEWDLACARGVDALFERAPEGFFLGDPARASLI